MARRCSPTGLLLAGLIVTLIGLVVGLRAALALPDHWTTLAVGLALLIAGALRAGIGRRRSDSSPPRAS